MPSWVNHESSVSSIISTVLAGADNKIPLLVVVFRAFGQCSWYTSYSRTTHQRVLCNMHSAAAMLRLLVACYAAVSTRIVFPPRDFVYHFVSLVLLPRKKLFILPQKCLSILKSLLSLWNSALGKCVMSKTKPRNLIAVSRPNMMCKVATPANACTRRPCAAQNKGLTLIATPSFPISLQCLVERAL